MYSVASLLLVSAIVLQACGQGDTEKGVPGVIREKIALVESEDAHDRVQGLLSLHGESHGTPMVIKVCIRRLEDSDWLVRTKAASTLGSFGKRGVSAIPALLSSLSDRNPQVVAAAAKALGSFRESIGPKVVPGSKVVPRLVELMSKETDFNPALAYALSLFGVEGRDAVLLVVRRLEEDHDLWECCAALRAFGVPSPRVIQVLRDVAMDANAELYTRMCSIDALGAFGPHALTTANDLLLLKGDDDLSEFASDALKSIRRED